MCQCLLRDIYFLKNRSLGRIFLVVRVSVYLSIYLSVCLFPFHVNFFKASHWPSDHMIRSLGFSRVFYRVFPGFPLVFPGFPRGFPRFFLGFSRGFTWVFRGFPGFSGGFPRVFLKFSRDFPGVCPGYSQGFSGVFRGLSGGFFRGYPGVFPWFSRGFLGFSWGFPKKFFFGEKSHNLKKKNTKKIEINHATYPKLYQSYYSHWSRDSLSPVLGGGYNSMATIKS